MNRLAAGILSCGVLAICAPAAGAQEVPAPVPPEAETPTPTPAPPTPAPRAGRVSVSVVGASGIARTSVYRRVTVRAALRPYVAGERLTIRAIRQGRSVAVRTAVVRRAGGLDAGLVRLTFTPKLAGTYSLRAQHVASASQGAGRAAKTLHARYPNPTPGTRGPGSRLLQRLLAMRGYAVPHSGVFDGGTGRALLAFRKVNGMRRIAVAGPKVWRKLVRGGGFKLRYPGASGKHVEVDLSRQVMALATGRRIYRVYHVSTGKPSTPTVRGRFHFYLKTFGVNAKGMIDAVYFIRGYAVHGYASVPVYAASHGCVRIPPQNALFVNRWLSVGDRIDVYR